MLFEAYLLWLRKYKTDVKYNSGNNKNLYFDLILNKILINNGIRMVTKGNKKSNWWSKKLDVL